MSVIARSVHHNIVPRITAPRGLFGCDVRAMADVAIPGVAVTCGALPLCVSRARTALSKRGGGELSVLPVGYRGWTAIVGLWLSTGVGVGLLFCLGCWDRGRACARGGGTAQMRKRHIPPHPAQPRHTDHGAPRTRKRHQQEHRPHRPTESSDPTQHAKGRTGDCPGPRKGTTTRRHVTQGGGGGTTGPAQILRSWIALLYNPTNPLVLFFCVRPEGG